MLADGNAVSSHIKRDDARLAKRVCRRYEPRTSVGRDVDAGKHGVSPSAAGCKRGGG